MSRKNRIDQFVDGFSDYVTLGFVVTGKTLLVVGKTLLAMIVFLALITVIPFAFLGWICKKCKGNAK